MVIHRDETRTFPIDACHGGTGALICREILGDYEKAGPGVKYIHDDTLAPGVSIGEHRHEGDEEVYVILEGTGVLHLDGRRHEVGPGDVCLTRHGQRHSLENTGTQPMRLLVVAANR